MTAQLSRERREIIKQTANHIISREDTSEHSENLKAVAELALLALAGMDSETVALQNFRAAMEGIGHIRRTLDETFGGLHGTHCEPDVRVECKAICDAICEAYRRTAPPAPVAVPDEIEPTSGSSDFEDYYCDGWNACRAAMLKAGPVTAVAVPEGWKLVPVEPTDAMCDIKHVGVDVCTGLAEGQEYYSICGEDARRVYRAMLAAAPEQEV